MKSSADTVTPGTGALHGVRVVELASENAAFAGKLLADLGADVIVVEPTGGHATRQFGPFVDDVADPEGSLWWWYYNTSKRSVTLDLETPDGASAFTALVGTADLVLEGEKPGTLARLGVDHTDLRSLAESLIWVSVTPFGRTGPRAGEEATDLTILAAGGPVWNCGYDDHTLPPVRGGGNQAMHIGGSFAAMSALTALLFRDSTGTGQHIDVSMYAAANVTTESGSFDWLVAERTVQRQTGRHAMSLPTMEVQVLAGDGRYVTTGFAPREASDFQMLIDWLGELGIGSEFAKLPFLEMGVERGGVDPRAVVADPLDEEIFSTGREALVFIASRMDAYSFFIGSQQRNFQCGIVYSPEEALADPHFKDRKFPVDVMHPEIGRMVTYPGAPFKMTATPWRIYRRPPLVGEHNDELDIAHS